MSRCGCEAVYSSLPGRSEVSDDIRSEHGMLTAKHAVFFYLFLWVQVHRQDSGRGWRRGWSSMPPYLRQMQLLLCKFRSVPRIPSRHLKDSHDCLRSVSDNGLSLFWAASAHAWNHFHLPVLGPVLIKQLRSSVAVCCVNRNNLLRRCI